MHIPDWLKRLWRWAKKIKDPRRKWPVLILLVILTGVIVFGGWIANEELSRLYDDWREDNPDLTGMKQWFTDWGELSVWAFVGFLLIAILLLIWWWLRRPITTGIDMGAGGENQQMDEQPTYDEEQIQRGRTRDALIHVTVEGSRRLRLAQHRAFDPWRIAYPVFIGERRGLPLRITGFNFTFLWDDSPIQRVTWRVPDGDVSNGVPLRPGSERVEGFDVGGDHDFTLEVPINGRQIGSFPEESPQWSGRGHIYFIIDGQDGEKDFNLSDSYVLSQEDWDEWKAQFS